MNAIDVWYARVSEHAEREGALALLLDEAERTRAAAFRFPADRTRFIVAHGLLRETLAASLACDPAALRFVRAPGGKPELEVACGLQFNLSHAGDLIALAVGRGRALGIDVEERLPLLDREEITASAFSPAERARLAALAPEERETAFYAAWTRKEAYLKAVGRGIVAGMAGVEVSFEPGAVPRLLGDRSALEGEAWTMHDLRCAESYSGALVYAGDAARVKYARLPGADKV